MVKAILSFLLVLAILAGILLLLGAQEEPATATGESPVLLLNITSGPVEDPHAVTMALQLAGHALDDGREVALFFNVRGVDVASNRLPTELAFSDRPIRVLLADVIERGAEAHVCPHCMEAMDLTSEDLVEGAFVTDRTRLFGRMGQNTVALTY